MSPLNGPNETGEIISIQETTCQEGYSSPETEAFEEFAGPPKYDPPLKLSTAEEMEAHPEKYGTGTFGPITGPTGPSGMGVVLSENDPGFRKPTDADMDALLCIEVARHVLKDDK